MVFILNLSHFLENETALPFVGGRKCWGLPSLFHSPVGIKPRLIILDNASFHKKQEFLAKIELVWHSAKEYIAHREFETKEEPRKIVKRLLNEGELIIN